MQIKFVFQATPFVDYPIVIAFILLGGQLTGLLRYVGEGAPKGNLTVGPKEPRLALSKRNSLTFGECTCSCCC